MFEAVEQYYIPEIGYFINRKCTQSWKIERQEISFHDITYVTEGQARYIIDGIAYDVRAGDLLCLPPGVVREAVSDPADLMGCYSANFQLCGLRGESLGLPFPLLSHIGVRGELITYFRELSESWLHKEPGFEMKSQAYLILILQRVLELTVYKVGLFTMDSRIRKSIKYMTDNYFEDISVAALAAAANLRPVYFGALFKQETGATVSRYLAGIRVNNAENLLKSGEYTVGEVSGCCGYNDVHHFRKQFKEIKGYLPSQCIP